jgi:phage gp29-like protein
MTVEFMQASSGASKTHDPFLAMADWADKAMSKAILGGTLTTQADGKTSTNALGNVHNEVRQELVKSDAKQLAGTLTRDLIYPLLVLNGHNITFERCPRFEFDLIDTADVTVWSDALGKLVDIGVQIPLEWVHKELGIPQAVKDEAVLSRAVQNTPQKTAQQTAQKALLKAGSAAHNPMATLSNADMPDLSPALLAMIAPLVEAFNQDGDVDNVADELLRIAPQMQTQELTQALTRVLFVADVWAQINFEKRYGQS